MKQGNWNTLLLLLLFSFAAISLVADTNDDISVIKGLYQDNNYNLALQEIQRFRQTYPNDELLPALQIIEGNIALHKQEYNFADSLFESIDTTKIDEDMQADLLLGKIQVKYYLGDYSLSSNLVLQYKQRYLKSDESWQAIYWSARLSIKSQKYDDAIQSLRSIENRPEHNIIYTGLVQAYALKLQINDSEKYLRLLKDEYPQDEFTNQAYINQLQALYSLGQYDSIRTYLQYSIPEKSIYFMEYQLVLGKSFYMLHNYPKSLEYLNLIQPESEEARFYKAMNYYQQKDDNKAKKIFVDLSDHARNTLIRSSSFLQNQIIVFETDPEDSDFNLKLYIKDHPNDPLIGAYNFQLGYNFYRQKKYTLASTHLTQAISNHIDSTTEDKAYYLIGDIYYLTDDKIAAELSFLDYLKLIPEGQFTDEVLCKLGFIYYDKKDNETAKAYFQRILDKYRNSDKWAISNFYMGEINYYKSNYIIAKQFYTQSLKGKLDNSYLWLRISQCDYFVEDYTNTLTDLQKLPEKKEFLFDKYLIQGNVYFNTKEYKSALDSYKIAEKNYRNKAEWEQVISQEALVYYLLKQYPEATAIYKQLSQEASTPDKFLLLAASSAYSAQDYMQAIHLYNLYITDYPNSVNRDKAQLGIADSHYNLGNFTQATVDYLDIIQRFEKGRFYENVLKSLAWSLQLAKDQDYTDALKNLEINLKDADLKLKIQRIHLDYVKHMQEWNKTVKMADELIQSGTTDIQIKMVKAEALAKLKRFSAADSVYQDMDRETLGAEAYLAWANVDLMRGDSLAALTKMKISSEKTRDSMIWIPLLTLQVQMNDPDFRKTYTSFMKTNPVTGSEEADLLWCDWAIKHKQYDEVNTKLKQLVKTKDRQIRGKADFLEAKFTFLNDRFQDAIPELARIKYLYPEMSDLVLESQYMLCISYIRTKDLDSAKLIYYSIKADLNASQVSLIEETLSPEGGER